MTIYIYILLIIYNISVTLTLSYCLVSGNHSNCCQLVGVKRLPMDSEPRLLEWLAGGDRFPSREQASEHKAQCLCSMSAVSVTYRKCL